MSDQRHASAETVIRECSWGDYLLTPTNLLHELDSGDPGSERFLFSKIIENSPHPSRHLRVLSPPAALEHVLHRHLSNPQVTQRSRIVAASLTGDFTLVPELSWNR
ncbi:hypothetical protein [Desulfonatronum thioautotrophicum]|uniref:hypothetical protein n=1 Tax=Desulfonatronum thioautotrophicum TaxID=617001 RepID=UPI0005EB5B41|nr:hypothetical protein [Desulfonatronum thioautotrophicum]